MRPKPHLWMSLMLALVLPLAVACGDGEEDDPTTPPVGDTATPTAAPTEKPTATPATDADQDGYTKSEDCDDENKDINPGADEVCNEVDDNCDLAIDEGVTETFFEDADEDGFGNDDSTEEACEAPRGYVSDGGDCNDAVKDINPDATEVCDELDNDCDGGIDTGLTRTFYADADKDGYGAEQSSVERCEAPDGYVTNADDCNDGEATIHPMADEVCNSLDDDCDNEVDEGLEVYTYFVDADKDTYGNPNDEVKSCATSAPDGAVVNKEDCDDTNVAVNPAAEEVCDEIDNNCDGNINEELVVTWYKDGDADGYGGAETAESCVALDGYVRAPGDCDDTDAETHPEADELCDGKDNNCNGSTEDENKTWYLDADADTWGDATKTTQSCLQPDGHVSRPGDCDDQNAMMNPAAQETCNELDDNCNGVVDDTGTPWYPDSDQDQWGDASATPTIRCVAPEGYVSDHSDCNDKDAAINPTATDGPCFDGVDQNCNGVADDMLEDDPIDAIQNHEAQLIPEGDAACLLNVVAISPVTEPFLGYDGAPAVGFFVNEPDATAYDGILVEMPAELIRDTTFDLTQIQEGQVVSISGVYREDHTNSALVLSTLEGIRIETDLVDPPAPMPIENPCDVGGNEQYEGMNITTYELTVDEVALNSFSYAGCVNVSTALFYTAQDAPDFAVGQPIASVTGILFARDQLDIEILDIPVTDFFSYVDPPGGYYTEPISVTFYALGAVEEATIYYTLDGTDPTTTSTSVKSGESVDIGPDRVTLRYFASTGTQTESVIHQETYRFDTSGQHLLLTEVVMSPSEAEFIEIYNPTDQAIPLNGYYLTDNVSQTTAPQTPYEYAKIVDGTMKIDANGNDFVVAFPADAEIGPGAAMVVALKDAFSTSYGTNPDFEISTETTDDDIPNMKWILPTTPKSSIGLTNEHEMVMLFQWDGTSDLVKDVDYFLWETKASTQPREAVVKTGQSFDSKDEDSTKTAYLADTARDRQDFYKSQHQNGQSFCRVDPQEGSEQALGGNGLSGHDETSEDFSRTWDICRRTNPGLY